INTTTRVEHTCNAFPCMVENKDTGEKVTLTCGDENLIIKDGHLAVSMADDAAPAVASAPAEAPSQPSTESSHRRPRRPPSPQSRPSTRRRPKPAAHSKHARVGKHKKGATVALAE